MYNVHRMGKLCLRIIVASVLCFCVCGCQWIVSALDSFDPPAGGSNKQEARPDETPLEEAKANADKAAMQATYDDGIPRIRVGVDVIARVSVVGEPVHEFEMRADQNGEVMPPYLLTEPVKCDKMTLDEFRLELVKRYRKYIKQPQISVRFSPETRGVSPYGYVKVLGFVNNPGPVTVPPTMDLTVTKALREAGGFRQFANHRKVLVTRRQKDGSLTKTFVDVVGIGEDGKEDLLLKSGDVVYVKETWW